MQDPPARKHSDSPLTVKDSDGQELSMSFFVDYQLQKDNLYKLYSDFMIDYERVFVAYIDNTVR